MKFEWISAKERLPEESGTYIVTIRYPEFGTAYTTLIMWSAYHHQWSNGDNLERNDDERDAEWNRIVTHWMELPEPAEVEA